MNQQANEVIYKVADDWRGELLARIRTLIKETDPDVVIDVKWKTPKNPAGVLVWYHDGMICTGETYQKHLRIGFTKGPDLKDHDPKGLINTHRAIIIYEEDSFDESAFKDLFRAAVELNVKHKAELAHKKKK